MAATILCTDTLKEPIRKFLLEQMEEELDRIDEDLDSLTITETETGLEVTFPVGEIYGYTYDYVVGVSETFKCLKDTHPEIGITGLVYEFETVSAVTCGFYFRCQPTDTKLTVTDRWQICTMCDHILETDAVYNSSQWDFEEGTVECLCCPTCMLQYALDPFSHWDRQGLDPNASFTEEEQEELWDDEDEDALSNHLWNRICENLEDYMDDFAAHRDGILRLLELENLPVERKAVLMEILNRTA